MPSAPDASITRLSVLIVEDSPLDCELLLTSLEASDFAVASRRVENADDMRAALAAQSWDAVIADHKLPAFSSLEAMAVLKESGLDLPFIIVSGEMGEDLAVEAMRAGADDYLLKGRTTRLRAALERSIEASRSRIARRRAEAALRESEARLQSLARHLGDVREFEQERLATLIHDDIGSALTAAKLVLAHTRKRLDSASDQGYAKDELPALGDVERIIDDVVATCHTLIRRLRPPLLDQGLASACDWLLADVRRRTGLTIRFEADRELPPLSPSVATAAYRTVEEAFLNTEKHARAVNAECAIHAADGRLTLLVKDDGCGFTSAERRKGFGLTIVTERIHACGGDIDIASPKSGGTTIAVDLPCLLPEQPS